MEFKPKETLTEQVAQHIENMIAFGKLKSGERIYENAMAKDLNVSHGSIREALLLLEKRHLVRNIPRKGCTVTELDEHFVKSLYEMLLLILCHTGTKLLLNRTEDDLHNLESLYQKMSQCFQQGRLMEFLDLGIQYTQISLAYADNYFMVSAIQDLWPSAKRCAFMALREGPKVLQDNLDQMRHSIDAIKARDEEELIRIINFYGQEQCDQVLASVNRP
ncbi:transcriptional regulator [Oleiphilus messinensis]|uniref:Transcriptional regulator n=1 Tax=Oleiphilus messinensis TaxID=141451 RepID=A0A1Y0I3F2_9GAMM|nr:GntR family transcriptional regulator [Oleiphilus messinensis]ARU54941.1 transcriptional regulator [Oleiphilus messinensis]